MSASEDDVGCKPCNEEDTTDDTGLTEPDVVASGVDDDATADAVDDWSD